MQDSPYTPAPAKIIQSTQCNFKPAYPGFPCLASSFSQKLQQRVLPLLSAHVFRSWIDSGASSCGSFEYGVLHLLLLGICEYKSSSFTTVISACLTTQDLFVTLWSAACQAPLLQVDSLPAKPSRKPRKKINCQQKILYSVKPPFKNKRPI